MRKIIMLVVFGLLAAVLSAQPAMAQWWKGGTNGNVYSGESVARAWGGNFVGQLGNGTTTQSNTPVRVSNLSNVQAIAAGSWHSLAKVLKPPLAQQEDYGG